MNTASPHESPAHGRDHAGSGAEDIRLWVGAFQTDGLRRTQPSAANAAVLAANLRGGEAVQFGGASFMRRVESKQSMDGSDYRSEASGDHVANGSGMGDDGEASEGEDEDKGCWHEAAQQAQYALREVTSRLDFLLGLVCLGVALYMRVFAARRDDGEALGRAWRWVLFAACILLGRFLARTLVAAAIMILERVSKGPAEDVYCGRLQSIIFYLHVLRVDIKNLLLCAGITVSWRTLIAQPTNAAPKETYETTLRAMICVCVLLMFRVFHQLLIKSLTSRLHSSTFWEQLHSTARQENILKKLAGAPIRPRPRPKPRAKARWKLVKNVTSVVGRQGPKGGSESPGRSAVEKARAAAKRMATAAADMARGGLPRQRRDSTSSDHSVTGSEEHNGRNQGHGSGSNAPTTKHGDGASKTHPATWENVRLDNYSPHSTIDSVNSVSELNPAPLDLKSILHRLDTESSGREMHSSNESPMQSPQPIATDGERSPLNTVDEAGIGLQSEMSVAAAALPTAPISAAAAAAAVGASEEPPPSTDVPLAVINAAVRHVRRGYFNLPFKKMGKSLSALRKDPVKSAAMSFSRVSQVNNVNGGALNGESTTEQEANHVAKLMFNHLRRAREPFVTPDAVADFIEADKVEEAFDLIGGKDSGVSALALSNIEMAMRKIYMQRQALAKTLKDTSGLVQTVGAVLGVALGVVLLFICLGIFKVDIAALWLLVTSGLLAFAFVFGTTLSTMFRALVMIFITNPFSVGDWIRLNNENVCVKELGITFFVVENFWGEILFVPANIMVEAQMYNLSRSPPLWMQHTMNVDIGLSSEDFDHISNTMTAHIDSDSTNYTAGSFDLYCRKIDDPLKIQLMCFYQLAFNAAEFNRKLRANSRFVYAFQMALTDINLSFASPEGVVFKCESRNRGGNSRLATGGSRRQSVTLQAAKAAAGTVSTVERQTAVGAKVDTAGTTEFATREEAIKALRIDGERPGGEMSRVGGSGSVLNPDFIPPADALSKKPPTTGLRYRTPYRLPGKLRHYSGKLRDMQDLVAFDVHEGDDV